MCCSLLSLLLVVRWRATPERHVRRRQVVLALVTAAALLSWYLQLFVLVLEALLCWRGRQRSGDHPAATSAGIGSRGLVALAGGVLLAAPLYAFVLPGLLAKMRQGITVTEGTPVLPSAATVLAGLAQALMGQPGGLATDGRFAWRRGGAPPWRVVLCLWQR